MPEKIAAVEEVRGLVREILPVALRRLALHAVEPLVDHRERVARVLVTATRGDVVALGNAPLVRCADVLVGPTGEPLRV